MGYHRIGHSGSYDVPGKILHRWTERSLAAQFSVAGGVVALAAMIVVGFYVTRLIEEAVIHNSAASTAMYVDSIIAPILPDMQRTDVLDDSVTRALDETLAQGALRGRIMSFRLWRRDGLILYANDKQMVGKIFPNNTSVRDAFQGKMVAKFDDVEDEESKTERESGEPLLEIYNPVLQPWSGEVVAVTEFYEIGQDFKQTLVRARLRAWAAVALFTSVFFGALSIIVVRGSRMIEKQREALRQRVDELSVLLSQNRALHEHVRNASQKAAAFNESHLRRIGAELHDGPAQLVALASMRLDSRVFDPLPGKDERYGTELGAIRKSLEDALDEIRAVCQGLVLPHIETLALSDAVRHAVRNHQHRTGAAVSLVIEGDCPQCTVSAKVCVYRFIQEGLNNAFRHAGGKNQVVKLNAKGDRLHVRVSDGGCGFDVSRVPMERIGLSALKERIESLGGTFSIDTSANGTALTMTLLTSEVGIS